MSESGNRESAVAIPSRTHAGFSCWSPSYSLPFVDSGRGDSDVGSPKTRGPRPPGSGESLRDGAPEATAAPQSGLGGPYRLPLRPKTRRLPEHLVDGKLDVAPMPGQQRHLDPGGPVRQYTRPAFPPW